MVPLVSRTGRELQRHTANGGRIVVGCVPYRVNSHDGSIEVLVITSQKGKGMLFPKGGWEIDESIEDAVCREAVEEAGVQGEIKDLLGKWDFESKRFGQMYEGHMYSLYVTEELDLWPEKNVRNRKWITVAEAREGCQYWWMIEALEIFATNMSRTCKSQFSDVEAEDQKQGNCLLENEITNRSIHVEEDEVIRSLEKQRNCKFQEAKQRNHYIEKEIAPRFSLVEKDEETLSVGKHRCYKSCKQSDCTSESQYCSQVKEDEGLFSVSKQRNCNLHYEKLRNRNCKPENVMISEDHGVFSIEKQRIFELGDAKRRSCNIDGKMTSKSSQVEADRLFTIPKQRDCRLQDNCTTESHVDGGVKSIDENQEHRYPQDEVVMIGIFFMIVWAIPFFIFLIMMSLKLGDLTKIWLTIYLFERLSTRCLLYKVSRTTALTYLMDCSSKRRLLE